MADIASQHREGELAYVVLAHKSPERVARLVNRLSGPRVHVLVHVDRSTPQAVHDEIARLIEPLPRTAMLPRVRCTWAGWGIVAAQLIGFERALALSPAIEHVAVVSGQDYPLAPSADILDFLAEFHGVSFAKSWSLPYQHWERDGGMHRFRNWHAPVRGRRLTLPIPRRFPAGVMPYGGSLWVCLSRGGVAEILDFVRVRPDAVRFYRHVWIPDESFVVTALRNRVPPERVIRENLWYIDWPEDGGPHPRTLVEADAVDLGQAVQAGSRIGGHGRRKLWARKFDEPSRGLEQRIDAELLARGAD